MNRIVAVISLMLFSAASLAGNDIWNTLFKEKLAEAEGGDSAAQYDVGTMYQNGRGVEASRDKAVEWYKKAAAQGNPKAATRLKLMDSNASRFGKTLAQAESGNAESQYEVGNMYMMGIGAEIDYAKAISFFEKSAGQGYSKAAYKLGLVYNEGTGVKTSKADAFKWFKVAAESKYPAAQYYLGKLYAAGEGTSQDYKQAVDWLSKAVDGGFDQARGELINVQEQMSMESAAASAKKQEAAEKQAAEKARAEREAAEKAARAAREAAEKAARAEKEAAEREARAKNDAERKAAAKAREEAQRKEARARAEREAAEKAAKKAAAAGSGGMDLVMNGAWSRDNMPVAYLPSSLNTCRAENDQVICFSSDQTRESGGNIITFKTKSIVDNFDNSDRTFKVTYRNLVISASPVTGTDLTASDEEASGGYKVKTGWGSPHTMDCSYDDNGEVSCLKNNVHAMHLVNTLSVASGR